MDANEHEDEGRPAGEGQLVEFLTPEVSPAIAAEINQQVATAQKYRRRRDTDIATEIRSRAILNNEIASECMYSLKRGDKPITGPSARFAEIVMASYGNLRVAARFVRVDADDPARAAVVVEAVCHDVQTNVARCVPTRRSIMTSAKNNRIPTMFSADMINTTMGAAASIAAREAILKVVPKAIWIDAYQAAVAVIKGDGTTLVKRRQEIMDAFGRVGVTPDRVYAALGVKDITDITIEHMPELFGFMTAIKEGESPDGVFGRAKAAAGAHDVITDPLKNAAPSSPKIVVEPKAQPQPQQQPTPAVEQAQVQPDPQPQHTQDQALDLAFGGNKQPQAQQPQQQAPLPDNSMSLPLQQPTQNAAPAAEGEPTTPEAYCESCRAYWATNPPAGAIRNRWAREAALRAKVGLGLALAEPLIADKEAAMARNGTAA